MASALLDTTNLALLLSTSLAPLTEAGKGLFLPIPLFLMDVVTTPITSGHNFCLDSVNVIQPRQGGDCSSLPVFLLSPIVSPSIPERML